MDEESKKIQLKSMDKKEISVGELLQGKLLMVFLRHFGWIFCREMAVEFVNRYSQVEKTKTKLIFIGSGTTIMAQGFHQEYIKNDNVECFIDSNLNLYSVLKLKKMGILSVFGLDTLKSGKRAIEKGFSQGSLQGDTFQLGGCFFFDNDKLIFSFVESYAGELPNFEEIIKILE